jgi:hypothetical protein
VAAGPPLSVETSFRTSRIVHAALVGSLLLYAVMIPVLREVGVEGAGLDPRILANVRIAFYAVAGALAVAALVLRSRWLTAEAAAALPRSAPGPPPLALLQTRLVTCLALVEGIGILGLVFFLIGGTLGDSGVFLLPAIGLQLLFAPSREVWDAAARGRA